MHLVLSILLTFLTAFSAKAQDPDKTDPTGPPYGKSDKQFKNAPLGFEIGFYSGYGWNSPGCSPCYPEQWAGGWLGAVPNQVVSSAEGSQSIYLSVDLNFQSQASSLT
jgi:hypothetical protein